MKIHQPTIIRYADLRERVEQNSSPDGLAEFERIWPAEKSLKFWFYVDWPKTVFLGSDLYSIAKRNRWTLDINFYGTKCTVREILIKETAWLFALG